jgi:hypothetical protein
MRTLVRLSLALVGLATLGCGPTNVRHYDGPELGPEQVTYLYTNPHLEIIIDRDFTHPRDKKGLHRYELPAGHHAIDVKCLYTSDVSYRPVKGAEGSTKPVDTSYTESPVISLVMDGEPGQSYKPRVRFERDADGIPGCHVRMKNVTKENGGEKVHLY